MFARAAAVSEVTVAGGLRAAGTTMVLAAEMGRTTVGLITWWLWATESKDLSIKYGPVGFKALRSASVV